ncbi:MAG: family 16 glycoside hydrolase [Bacteroidota bacterium]
MRLSKCILGLLFLLTYCLLPAQEPGLLVEAYQLPGPTKGVPALVPGQRPNAIFEIPELTLEGNRIFGDFQQHFFFRIRGKIKISDPDTYKFRITADDWARININDAWLADTDDDSEGLPQMREFDIALEKGTHTVEVWYYNGDRTKRLKWEWFIKGIRSFVPVPKEALMHEASPLLPFQPGLAQMYSPQARAIPGDQRPLAGLHPALKKTDVLPRDWGVGMSGLFPTEDGFLVSTWVEDGSIYQWNAHPDSTPVSLLRGLDLPTSLGKTREGFWVLQQNELTLLQDSDNDGKFDQFQLLALLPLKTGERATQAIRVEQEFFVVVEGAKQNLLYKIGPDGNINKTKVWPGQGLQLSLDKDGKSLLALHQGPDQWTGLKRVDPETMEAEDIAFIPPSLVGYPGALLPLEDGPYKGHLLIGDQRQGSLRRLYQDNLGNTTMLRFSAGLSTVPALMLETEKGFITGGQHLPGIAEAPGTRHFGLDRMTWQAGKTMEILSLSPVDNGILIRLSQTLHPHQNLDTADIDLINFGLNGQPSKALDIKSVSRGPDPKTIFVQTGSVTPNQLLYIHLKKGLYSDQDHPLLSSEAWCYVKKAGPSINAGEAWPIPTANTLTASEKAEGWQLLFDGTTTTGWRNPHQKGIHEGWQVEEGALVRAGDGAGDIITTDQYEAFELRMEWKIAPGGNSGVFFHVEEGEKDQPIYVTGPEMQILDDLAHPDRKYHSHRSGSNYDLHPAAFEALRPVGSWNEVRLIVRPNGQVEHWLNGYRIVSYTLGDADWQRRVKASKFASMPEYGRIKKGHIGLQDHGDKVSFRNVKILPF